MSKPAFPLIVSVRSDPDYDDADYSTCIVENSRQLGRMRQTAEQRGFRLIERRPDDVEGVIRWMRGDDWTDPQGSGWKGD